MAVRNAFYAQSGGVTAVINATACGLIQTARRFPLQMGTVLAARNGIAGALAEDLIDTATISEADLALLRRTPGGVFGSSRYPLRDRVTDRDRYQRLLDVLAAHDVGYFFYNGGNGSMETVQQVDAFAREQGYPLVCIGLPKTIDNDLMGTDTCPGFGSAAKYVATSVREIALDVQSMASSSTQVYVLEVMGRHAGWLAAAAGLASACPEEGPQLLLFPERPLDKAKLLAKVDETVSRAGYCIVVAAEGVCAPQGSQVQSNDLVCAPGGVHAHGKPGQVGKTLAGWVADELGLKYHWGLMDYLQRSAGHLVSATDQAQAYAIGEAAVQMAMDGKSGVMIGIERLRSAPYQWRLNAVPLDQVAGRERRMPSHFIEADGWHISEACREYLQPLLEGESWPPYQQGLPNYAQLTLQSVSQRLKLRT